MKEVRYGPGFERHPKLLELAKGASQLFPGLFTRSTARTTVEWDVAEAGAGNPTVILRFTDAADDVTGIFEREVLEDKNRLRGELLWLWDRFLGVRSGRMVRGLMADAEAGG